MFSGAWRETTMDTVELQMPDENIDREALHEALGSLYRNSVLIPLSLLNSWVFIHEISQSMTSLEGSCREGRYYSNRDGKY